MEANCGPDNDLLPNWHEAIFSTNSDIIDPKGTNFNEILINYSKF